MDTSNMNLIIILTKAEKYFLEQYINIQRELKQLLEKANLLSKLTQDHFQNLTHLT